MNENIDLTKILKDCPNGWEFDSGVHGDVKFITLLDLNKILFRFKDGKHYFDIVSQVMVNYIKMVNVLYFLQKTKEIGVNSPLLGSKRRGSTLRH